MNSAEELLVEEEEWSNRRKHYANIIQTLESAKVQVELLKQQGSKGYEKR